MAYTHLAEVRNISGELCRAYVKHFPNNQPRALFNECFGHAVMSAMGVPQPPCAVMLAPVFEADPPMIAWSFISCQPRPTFDGTPKEIYKIEDAVALSILIKRIFSCPMLPLLIAADQLVMNGDRNLGNFVFTGKRAFVAIDHGEIMGGGAGTNDALLRPTGWAVSKLIEELVSISAVPQIGRAHV